MKIIGSILAGIGGILSLLGLFKSTAVPENFIMILLSMAVVLAIFIILHFWRKRKGWALPLMMIPVVAILVLHGIRLEEELRWTFDCLVNLPQNKELISTFWYDQFMDYFIYVYTFSGVLISSIGGALLSLKSTKKKVQNHEN